MRTELRKKITELLDATGLPWELKRGKKHIRVLLDGVQISVCSCDTHTGRDHRQVQAAINRHMRELRAEPNNQRPVSRAGKK